MKKVVMFVLATLCLFCSCADDPIVEEEVVSIGETPNSLTRTSILTDSICGIRFAMYETFNGYSVRINDVRIIQAPEEVKRCDMEYLKSGILISDDRSHPTYNNVAEIYHRVPVMENAKMDMIVEYDFTIISEDGCNEEINISNATFVIKASDIKWMRNGNVTYLVRISSKTNGTTDGNTAGLHVITFDADVETIS